jgi:hypothetical protein
MDSPLTFFEFFTKKQQKYPQIAVKSRPLFEDQPAKFFSRPTCPKKYPNFFYIKSDHSKNWLKNDLT